MGPLAPVVLPTTSAVPGQQGAGSSSAATSVDCSGPLPPPAPVDPVVQANPAVPANPPAPVIDVDPEMIALAAWLGKFPNHFSLNPTLCGR